VESKDLANQSAASPAFKLLQQTQYIHDTSGHLTEIKSNGATICTYSYDTAGRLVGRVYGNGITAKYAYDRFGRQALMTLTGGPLIEPLTLGYEWDAAGQLLSRTWNGERQTYSYDLSGQLLTVSAASASHPERSAPLSKDPANLKSDIRKASSTTPPPAANHLLIESYKYDSAGNMLEKFEHGLKTVMTYDAANQLKTSTSTSILGGTQSPASQTIFQYDLAGRLVSSCHPEPPEGPQTVSREYGLLDKVLVLTRPDGTRIGYDYYPDGQLAAKGPLPKELSSNPQSATPNAQPQKSGLELLKQLVTLKAEDADLAPSAEQKTMGVTEELVWDDLALLYRNGETYAIEPHVSGGVPIASSRDPQSVTKTYFINDILGTTLAVITPDRIQITPLTAFGKPLAMKTGSSLTPETREPQTLSPENESPGKHPKLIQQPIETTPQ
jgi:YD repeat-containing protein